MKSDKTLRENITWLLEYYKKDLEYEKTHDNNYDTIVDYENIITELDYALKISK